MDKIKLKIQNGEVEEAIQQLILDYNNTEYANELLLLSSRNFNLLRSRRRDVISFEEYDRAKNNIIVALLGFIDEIQAKSISIVDSKKIDLPNKKVLFCESNPLHRNLFSNAEIREIEEIIFMSKNQLELISKFGLSLVRFIRAIIRNQPHIIHFTAFSNDDGIHFHNNSDESDFISSDLFEKQIEIVADQFQCLFFNTFISEQLAKRISNEKVFVIGYNGIINSRGAIEFATGFYTAISYGKSYEEAFKVGYQSVLNGNFSDNTSKLYAYHDGEKLKQDIPTPA